MDDNNLVSSSKIVPQQRDLEILKYLHTMGFGSFPILQSMFFPSQARCSYRLIQLEQAGLISKSANIYSHSSIYMISKIGYAVLLNRFKSNNFPIFRNNFPLSMLNHNAHVSKARLVLESKFGATEWTSERELKTILARKKQQISRDFLPDGSFSLPNGTRYAIEIEIARKSKRRLSEKMITHVAHFATGWFDKCLFIATNKDVYKILTEVTNNYSGQFEVKLWNSVEKHYLELIS